MPTFDLTFILVFLSFLVFMVAMKAVFFDPIQAIKAQRESKIAQDKGEAFFCLEEADRLARQCEIEIHAAEKKAQQTIDAFRQQAKQNATEKITTARQDAQAFVEAQLATLHTERERVYHTLSAEREALAQMILARVTGRTLATPSGIEG